MNEPITKIIVKPNCINKIETFQKEMLQVLGLALDVSLDRMLSKNYITEKISLLIY